MGTKRKISKYKSQITRLYNTEYDKITKQGKAQAVLDNMLSQYSSRTKRLFIEQMEKTGMSPSQAVSFIEATERYNKNRQKAYAEEMERIEDKWREIESRWSLAESAVYLNDKGGLSEEGKLMHDRFVEDALSGVVPTSDKSLILSESLMQKESLEQILSTRMRMGSNNYINKREDTYISNFRKAIKENRDMSGKFLYYFDRLSHDEKLELIKSYGKSAIRIWYIKSAGDEAILFQDFLNTIGEISPKLKERFKL